MQQRGIDNMKANVQKITSQKTDVNYKSGRMASTFKIVNEKFNRWGGDETNLDIGGGAGEVATKYLDALWVENLTYDPYNRTSEHNQKVLARCRNGGAQTVTINNVLNVIQESECRREVLQLAKDCVENGGTVYIKIYEGNKSGQGSETSKGYQNNIKTIDYFSEIKDVFGNVTVGTAHGLIVIDA